MSWPRAVIHLAGMGLLLGAGSLWPLACLAGAAALAVPATGRSRRPALAVALASTVVALLHVPATPLSVAGAFLLVASAFPRSAGAPRLGVPWPWLVAGLLTSALYAWSTSSVNPRSLDPSATSGIAIAGALGICALLLVAAAVHLVLRVVRARPRTDPAG